MFVHDQATPLSRRRTPEGFLHLKARIGRAGLQDYKAGEIGGPPGAAPDTTVRVYRPPDEVFAPASLASFASKPVTLDHPPGMIDSGNWKRFAVGHAGETVAQDGDHVATDLVLTDAAAVARADAGAELSNGYWADFHFTPGLTPDGEPYDALQRNIRGNHIALVDAGRCGPSCTVGTDAPAADAMTADAAVRDCGCGEMRRITLDGSEIDVAPQAAAAIARFQAAQIRALALRDAEIAALRAAVPDAARLDDLVDDRRRVIDAARRVLGERFDGRALPTSAIRRAAVERLLGPERLQDRGDDYVAAAFDALAAVTRDLATPLAAHLASSRPGSHGTALAARDHYLTHAWKGETTGDR